MNERQTKSHTMNGINSLILVALLFTFLTAMIWIDYSEVQKSQLKFVGILWLVVLTICIGQATLSREWEWLRGILTLVGCFLAAVALLISGAWIVVRILTRFFGNNSNSGKKHDI